MINTEIYELVGFDEKERQNIEFLNFPGETIKEFKETESNLILRYNYIFDVNMSLEKIVREGYSVAFRGLEFFAGESQEIEKLIEDIFKELKEKNSKDFIFENTDQWAYLNFSKFNLQNGRSILMYSSDTFNLKHVVSLQKLKIAETIKKTNPIGLKADKKDDFKSELMKIVQESYPDLINDIQYILK